jgi:hypothetical protein
MPANNIKNYLKFITPTPGDPTYSLLKAHLLFEELLRAYLARTLQHSEALEGARLTFVQLLAVARACSDVSPDHWCWAAVTKLNKLRNLLSHETAPKALSEKIGEYVSFVVAQSGAPLPEAKRSLNGPPTGASSGPLYLAVDLATIGLYYSFSGLLGYDATAALQESDSYSQSLHSLLIPAGDQGAG